MDIPHQIHTHETGAAYIMQRVYVREKVKGKYCYILVAWRCPDCGTFVVLKTTPGPEP
jgi:hypothetical protein